MIKDITDEELIEGLLSGNIEVIVRESFPFLQNGACRYKAEFVSYYKKGLPDNYRVEGRSNEVLREAIISNGYFLFSLKNPTRELYELTLNKYPSLFRNLEYDDKTLENCLFAIGGYSKFQDVCLQELEEFLRYIPRGIKSSKEFKRGLIDLGLFDLLNLYVL